MLVSSIKILSENEGKIKTAFILVSAIIMLPLIISGDMVGIVLQFLGLAFLAIFLFYDPFKRRFERDESVFKFDKNIITINTAKKMHAPREDVSYTSDMIDRISVGTYASGRRNKMQCILVEILLKDGNTEKIALISSKPIFDLEKFANENNIVFGNIGEEQSLARKAEQSMGYEAGEGKFGISNMGSQMIRAIVSIMLILTPIGMFIEIGGTIDNVLIIISVILVVPGFLLLIGTKTKYISYDLQNNYFVMKERSLTSLFKEKENRFAPEQISKIRINWHKFDRRPYFELILQDGKIPVNIDMKDYKQIEKIKEIAGIIGVPIEICEDGIPNNTQ